MRRTAPEALRSALLTILDAKGRDSDGEFDPHDTVRRVLGKVSNQIGPNERIQELRGWINSLDMSDAQRVLSELALDEGEEELLNEALARADENIEIRDGNLVKRDAPGEVLGVLHLESRTTQLLSGRFAPVLAQYQRALEMLGAHPMNQEKAISEAVGSLEAVVRIVGGNKDFGANVNIVFRGQNAWTKMLSGIFGKLQGYRSQVPGAGHGRYADSAISDAEASFVVRTCGAAIAWVIEDNEEGRWI